MSIPFIQYKRPDGHAVPISIERPEGIEQKAKALIEQGARFEIEVLMSGQISMEIVKPKPNDDPDILAWEICQNGPDVLRCVDRMVLTALNPSKEEVA